jgi:uncharacterized protein (DUF2141 family)
MKFLVFICVAFWGLHLYAQRYDLSVAVTGLKSTDGEIQIGLYNNLESFPLVDEQYKVFFIDVRLFSGTYLIKDLPEGEYAVALFHDKNSDKVCNTNFLGIPKEGYGFSKNYRPVFSAPSFNDCKIDLNSNLSITIKLIY